MPSIPNDEEIPDLGVSLQEHKSMEVSHSTGKVDRSNFNTSFFQKFQVQRSGNITVEKWEITVLPITSIGSNAY